jgi:hypothetical protein
VRFIAHNSGALVSRRVLERNKEPAHLDARKLLLEA